MTKTLKTLAAVGVMLLAACSSEEMITDLIGDQTTVTYTVALPSDMSTRAYSDGETATYLTYAVYRDIDGTLELVDEQLRKNQFVNLQATVSLQLIKGYDYTIVFWADAGPKCPYTIDLESGTITMDYAEETTIVGNNEERDAFYKKVEVENVSTAINEKVELYRPFAQLNFGTNDLQADIVRNNAPVADIEFSVEVPAGLPTTLSLIDGTTDGATEDAVTFVYTGVPAESDGTFPVEGYEYVSMNYILASDDVNVLSDAVTLTATHEGLGEDGVVCTVNNVPLQRNYRTNIYGSLLTAPATYNITIEPAYLEPDYWTEEGLIAALKAGGKIGMLSDMTLTLSEPLNLTEEVELNLNGFTLTLAVEEGSTTYYYSIGTTANMSITNGSIVTQERLYVDSDATLTLTDVDIIAVDDDGAAIGVYYNTTSTENTISNSFISSKTSNDENWAYGVYVQSGTVTIEDCTIEAENTEVSAVSVQTTNTSSVVISNTNLSVVASYYAYNLFVTGGSNVEISGCYMYAESTNSVSGSSNVARNVNLRASDGGTVLVDDCRMVSRAAYTGTDGTHRVPTSVYLHNECSADSWVKLQNGCTTDVAVVGDEDGTQSWSDVTNHNRNGAYMSYTADCTFTGGASTPKATGCHEICLRVCGGCTGIDDESHECSCSSCNCKTVTNTVYQVTSED